MPAKSIPIRVSEIRTAAQFTANGPALPLGFQFEEDLLDGNGPKVWVYVQNGEAATDFVVGTCVMRKAAATTAVGVLLAATPVHVDRMIGVAQHTIPFGGTGFILKSGKGSVLADTGGVTADHILVGGNAVAGRADSVVATTVSTVGFGTCLTSATATNLCSAWLFCRG